MADSSSEPLLPLARSYLETITQELSPRSPPGEAIDLLLHTVRGDFDTKVQKDCKKLLEELDRLEKILDVELASGAFK